MCLAARGCHSSGNWDAGIAFPGERNAHRMLHPPDPRHTNGWMGEDKTDPADPLLMKSLLNSCEAAARMRRGWMPACLCTGCGWRLDSARFPACFRITRLVEAWGVGRARGWLGRAEERFKWWGGNWAVSPDFVLQLMNVSLCRAFMRELNHYKHIVFSSRFTGTWHYIDRRPPLKEDYIYTFLSN